MGREGAKQGGKNQREDRKGPEDGMETIFQNEKLILDLRDVRELRDLRELWTFFSSRVSGAKRGIPRFASRPFRSNRRWGDSSLTLFALNEKISICILIVVIISLKTGFQCTGRNRCQRLGNRESGSSNKGICPRSVCRRFHLRFPRSRSPGSPRCMRWFHPRRGYWHG